MDVRIGALFRIAAAVAVLTLSSLAVPSPSAAAVSSQAAERTADRDPGPSALREAGHTLRSSVSRDGDAWKVSYFAADREVAQVVVDAASGAVRESWRGHQVAWRMARGYEGQFGHKLNAPYVWIPLAALFFLGLLDWRRPWRVVHLDLLVLLSFGISQIFFNRGEIGISVPLAYPPLVYLLARMLWVGFRGAGAGLRPTAPVLWLAVATVFLLAFRVTLNVVDSGVIDVGYAGVIGADRIASGEPIYGDNAFPDDNPTGDTYGPANYYAYVPFELALPWSGEWDSLPAAHAAAIFFDLATVVGLLALGGRLRPAGSRGLLRPGAAGAATGTILAFAWAAYPYTALALQSNANDGLVAALCVWALVLVASPPARGFALGLAASAKFAPLALLPPFAAGERGLLDRLAGGSRALALRPVAACAAGFACAAALMMIHPAIDPGLATFYERTIANQLDRESPFSVWGQEPTLRWVQTLTWIAAGGLAAITAFVPRRRSLSQLAALGAAVVIATQLAVEHWFYLYLPWFLPLVLTATSTGPEGEVSWRRRARDPRGCG